METNEYNRQERYHSQLQGDGNRINQQDIVSNSRYNKQYLLRDTAKSKNVVTKHHTERLPNHDDLRNKFPESGVNRDTRNLHSGDTNRSASQHDDKSRNRTTTVQTIASPSTLDTQEPVSRRPGKEEAMQ